MSYDVLGSKTYKLPEDVPSMIALGRMEALKDMGLTLSSLPENLEEPLARIPPDQVDRLTPFFRGMLVVIPLVMQRLAQRERFEGRRTSFGLTIVNMANIETWFAFARLHKLTPERLGLDEEERRNFDLAANGKMRNLLEEVVDWTKVKDSGYTVIPFVLTPAEAFNKPAIKDAFRAMTIFNHAPTLPPSPPPRISVAYQGPAGRIPPAYTHARTPRRDAPRAG